MGDCHKKKLRSRSRLERRNYYFSLFYGIIFAYSNFQCKLIVSKEEEEAFLVSVPSCTSGKYFNLFKFMFKSKECTP